MGTTNKGLPYPEDTDPVAEGAQAIKALAEMLSKQFGRGVVSGNVLVSVSAGVGTADITFPTGMFGVPPVVMVTTTNSSYFGYIVSTSTTGATIGIRNPTNANATGSLYVRWLAHQN